MDDKMTGRGYMIWADGRRYDGEWLENRCNGRGVLTYRDGRRYEGEYKLDKMHGRGACQRERERERETIRNYSKRDGRGLACFTSARLSRPTRADTGLTGRALTGTEPGQGSISGPRAQGTRASTRSIRNMDGGYRRGQQGAGTRGSMWTGHRQAWVL